MGMEVINSDYFSLSSALKQGGRLESKLEDVGALGSLMGLCGAALVLSGQPVPGLKLRIADLAVHTFIRQVADKNAAAGPTAAHLPTVSTSGSVRWGDSHPCIWNSWIRLLQFYWGSPLFVKF